MASFLMFLNIDWLDCSEAAAATLPTDFLLVWMEKGGAGEEDWTGTIRTPLEGLAEVSSLMVKSSPVVTVTLPRLIPRDFANIWTWLVLVLLFNDLPVLKVQICCLLRVTS